MMFWAIEKGCCHIEMVEMERMAGGYDVKVGMSKCENGSAADLGFC